MLTFWFILVIRVFKGGRKKKERKRRRERVGQRGGVEKRTGGTAGSQLQRQTLRREQQTGLSEVTSRMVLPFYERAENEIPWR